MRRNRFSQERLLNRKTLVELLNLPALDYLKPADDPRHAAAFALAKRFIETYGPLRLVHSSTCKNKPAELRQRELTPLETEVRTCERRIECAACDPLFQEAEAFEYGRRLRGVWMAANKRQFSVADAELNSIFQAGDPVKREGPVFTTDIEAGTIRRKPHSLLQTLALELLDSRRAIRRCPVCGDFFTIKKGSRQKYCQNILRDCQHESRNEESRLRMRERRANKKEKNNAKRSNR